MTLSSSTMAGRSRLWSTRRGKILDPAGSLLEPRQPRKQRPFAGRRAAPAAGAASLGTTNWGETPDVGRPGERATAASVSRSGEAIHTTERLARRWLEVMTRAAWEAGLYPLLTQHEKMGLRTRCRLLEVAGQGAAVRHASRRFRDRDPQSRTRGEVLGVKVAVGHAVAQHVVARHRPHSSPGRADQRR